MAPWGTWRRWCWITAPTTPRSATATRTSGEGSGGGGTGGDPHIALPAPSRRTCPPAAPHRLPDAREAAPPLPQPLAGERDDRAPALTARRPRLATPLRRVPGHAPAARADPRGGTVTPAPTAREKERDGGYGGDSGLCAGFMCFVCLKSALSTPEAPQLGDSSRN